MSVIQVRKWLARKLFLWSCRVYEEWHEFTIIDAKGKAVATIGCYNDWTATWDDPDYDIGVCSCEKEKA